MSEFITYLQERIEQTKRKVQILADRIQKDNAEREMLLADLEGYERTMNAETRGVLRVIPPNDAFRDGLAPQDETNKAAFARQFIRQQQHGVLPKDLMRGFQEAGIPIGKPYIYALVQRLQKQGSIQQRRGKWVSVPAYWGEVESTATNQETNP